jgi:hypothetical protein
MNHTLTAYTRPLFCVCSCRSHLRGQGRASLHVPALGGLLHIACAVNRADTTYTRNVVVFNTLPNVKNTCTHARIHTPSISHMPMWIGDTMNVQVPCFRACTCFCKYESESAAVTHLTTQAWLTPIPPFRSTAWKHVAAWYKSSPETASGQQGESLRNEHRGGCVVIKDAADHALVYHIAVRHEQQNKP